MKKILALLLAVVMVLGLAACSGGNNGDEDKKVDLKVGFIFLHDEQSTYDKNFMVAANETVGSFIFYQTLPGIYRIHDKPDEKKLTNFFN